MIIRIAASLFVMLSTILLAHETVARSGGGVAASPPAAPPPASRPAAIRPFMHPGRAPFIHPGRAPFINQAGVRAHAFGTPFSRHRRFGHGWQGGWFGGSWYDPYYDTTGRGQIAPYQPPLPPPYPVAGYPAAPYPAAAPIVQRVIYVVPYRPGCDSQTQNLPWRDGHEHSVTIVRC
jgi:hypothetical protein